MATHAKVRIWRAADLPWHVGDRVTAPYSHARGHTTEDMLAVEAGEVGVVVELRDGWPADALDSGGAAYAIVRWPSGLEDCWEPPHAWEEGEDDAD